MTEQVLDQNTVQQAENAPAEQQEQQQAQTNVFEEFVGEDKKYKTPEDFVKSKLHGDEHIARIERENAELREELAKKSGVEEVLAQLRKPEAADTTENTTPSVDVESLVREALAKERQSSVAEANLSKANEEMQSVYGSKASEVYQAKAKELGVSTEFLKKTASESPAAFRSMMGLSAQTPTERTPSAVTQGMRTEGMATNNEDYDSYYAKMYREDRARYFSAEEQNRRYELAAQGKLYNK